MADIEKLEPRQEVERARSKSDNAFVNDIRHIIENGLKSAYQSVSSTMVHTYWQIGQRIVEEEQHGEKRAEYGTRLLEFLAEELSQEYATGFSARNLRDYRQFYQYFSDLEIWHSRVPNLSWTHFRMMLRVSDADARYWYWKRNGFGTRVYQIQQPTAGELKNV